MINGLTIALQIVKACNPEASRDEIIVVLEERRQEYLQKIQVGQDRFGNWFAYRGNFIGFGSSPFGTGANTTEAIADLQKQEENN